jgi:hypothetical protein
MDTNEFTKKYECKFNIFSVDSVLKRGIEIVIVDGAPFDNIPNDDNVIQIKHDQVTYVSGIINQAKKYLDHIKNSISYSLLYSFITEAEIPKLADYIIGYMITKKTFPKIILNFICCSQCQFKHEAKTEYYYANEKANIECLKCIIDTIERGNDVYVSDFSLNALILGSLNTDESKILFGKSSPLRIIGETNLDNIFKMTGIHREFMCSRSGQLAAAGQVLIPIEDTKTKICLLETTFRPMGSTTLFTVNDNWEKNSGIITDYTILSVIEYNKLIKYANIPDARDVINAPNLSLPTLPVLPIKNRSIKSNPNEIPPLPTLERSYTNIADMKQKYKKTVADDKYEDDYILLPGSSKKGLPAIVELKSDGKGSIFVSSCHWKNISPSSLNVSRDGLFRYLTENNGIAVSNEMKRKLNAIPQNMQNNFLAKIASDTILRANTSI